MKRSRSQTYKKIAFAQYPISRYEAKFRMLYNGYLQPQMSALRKREGFDYLELNGGFSSGLIRAGDYLDFCHLSDDGYRASAEKVADYIDLKHLLNKKASTNIWSAEIDRKPIRDALGD